MFRPVPTSANFPQLETEVGKFWLEQRIYEKSLERPSPHGPFIFYEGPPTANGMPHPGHCLTRAIKDLFPRYKTMQGYRCQRKAGWDTHGLPVEVEVCKELGIHSKEEIEAYGVEPFIQKCQQSVWRYMQEWERLTRRIGFWVDLDDAYVTYHQSYVESVWWALKTLFDKGLLYQGHKIVWWWSQGGTALSSGEVGQGYRQVADPSVYVRFPIVMDERAKALGLDADTSLLVWTTTPWTLPSNQFAAVHPELEYVVLEDVGAAHEASGRSNPPGTSKLIVARALVDTIRGKVGHELNVVGRPMKGSELVGLRYLPPFDCYSRARWNDVTLFTDGKVKPRHWRVVHANFVTIDSGTGIVHIAPAFGEVDYELLMEEHRQEDDQGKATTNLTPLLLPVAADGKFTEFAPEFCRGRWVKDCDKDIIRDLKHRGLLFHQEQYLHDYPFCWRAEEDPLIQYPRRSWFIRTSNFVGPMLENNEQINWLPEHIKHGRFGNFLETNVDWALSRERYWGTPLPIWTCSDPECNHREAIASYAELEKKPKFMPSANWAKAKKANPALVEDLKVHKPYIDDVTYACTHPGGKCDGTMKRVPEVIDCWFDSGAMPFAQWGYPHTGVEQFNDQFPADFISEALDQTRGWFYSQLAISTLLFGDIPVALPGTERSKPFPHPFKNCVVLGLMLGEDGQKMSKSKRNYREPTEIFDRYGADALRWYFFANQPPWTGIRYNEQAIKDSIPEFLLRLWNVYTFFVIYANIDGFEPTKGLRGELDDLNSDILKSADSYRPAAERSELDRWIAGELHRTIQVVTERMDAYDNFAACAAITAYVDALSNWYVRRSRDRFWREDKHDRDKLDGYWTLYECLLETTKLIAPFVPFLAETLWQNLAVAESEGRAVESVHLADYPPANTALVDETLSAQMALVREVVSLGRSARTTAKLKVRQPLERVEIVLVDPRHRTWLEGHAALVREELNVKVLDFAERADQYVTYTVLPDLKRLGPRLGKQLPAVKKALAEADVAALLARLSSQKQVELPLAGGAIATLDEQDVQVRLQAREGWAAAQGPSAVVVLSTELTPELRSEGIARELVHAIQTIRKDQRLEYTDRIELGIETDDPDIQAAAGDFQDTIASETLAVRVLVGPLPGVEPVSIELAGKPVKLYVKVARR
ncbi:MAG TPA: isoleucine--tRNA ligase [Pirellulales bacterium]|jgi:isoleucyl-tRNA synthetase|nr:isoleucine--tRNA ligase [Pirellulales bacterium]